TRLRAGLVLESGEPREVHHFAVLIGYGASAINPYLMLDTIDELARDGRIAGVEDPEAAERRIVKALGKALLKTISKMGISTIQSYCGAQIFEAVGLEKTLIDRHFTGTASRIGGIGLGAMARGGLGRRARAAGLARGPAARGRDLRVAARRRAPHVEPRDHRAAPARGPGPQRHRAGQARPVRGPHAPRHAAAGRAARAA